MIDNWKKKILQDLNFFTCIMNDLQICFKILYGGLDAGSINAEFVGMTLLFVRVGDQSMVFVRVGDQSMVFHCHTVFTLQCVFSI